jgi:hypothetical protein
MSTNQLLKDWWRYKATRLAPNFDIEKWLANIPEREREKTYVNAMADGINYGNWPWAPR